MRKLSIELTPGDQEEIEMEENYCFILRPCGSMVFSSLIQLDSESLRSSVEGVEICSIAMICMWERVWFGKLKCLVVACSFLLREASDLWPLNLV